MGVDAVETASHADKCAVYREYHYHDQMPGDIANYMNKHRLRGNRQYPWTRNAVVAIIRQHPTLAYRVLNKENNRGS